MAKLKRNRGAALAVSLVLMTLLTSLAVTLVYNTSLDTKMAMAFAAKGDALQRAIGGVDEFVFNAHNLTFAGIDINPLAVNLPVAVVKLGKTQAYAEGEPLSQQSTSCYHKRVASDAGIACNYYQVTSTRYYGKQVNKDDETAYRSHAQAKSLIATQVPSANH